MANCVFATISRRTFAVDGDALAAARSGSVGKSSFGSVCIRDSKRSAATFTVPFFSSSMRMSVSGSSFTISKNFFAGSVSAPGFAIDAGHVRAQAHLEVRGRQAHCVALGLDQHVGQNRNRVLAFDDALEQLQLFEEIGFSDDKFHGVPPLGDRPLTQRISVRIRRRNRDQEIILKGSAC